MEEVLLKSATCTTWNGQLWNCNAESVLAKRFTPSAVPYCNAGERGLDGLIAEYVAEAIDDLDAMTGDACVVFVFDLHDGDRSATAAEVYRWPSFSTSA